MSAVPQHSAAPTSQRQVSRVEIADHIETVFTDVRVHRDDLVRQAELTSARPAVLHVLAALPNRFYHHLGDLWGDLPRIPIDDGSSDAGPTSR